MEMINEDKGYKIYFNLHRGGFSIQHYVIGKGWRVRDYAQNLIVDGATFNVSETGRQRVLTEKKKNVHAKVMCEEYTKCAQMRIGDNVRENQALYYNPYKVSTFVDRKTMKEVKSADCLYLEAAKINGNDVGTMYKLS